MCLDCRWFHSNEPGMSCQAFPHGIPQEIITSEADHTKPFEDDGGVQFEPADPDNPAKLSGNPYLSGDQSIKAATK